jgi:UDP-N-acetyl-D-mannosaminuronate dehydrogenase
MDNARVVLGDRVQYLSLRQCLETADVIVIATAADEFRALKASDIPARKRRVIVFDCWRIAASSLQQCEWVEYVPLGHGREESKILRELAQAARIP